MQLLNKIIDFYNIPIGNAKKLEPNFLTKKSMDFIMKNSFKVTIEIKKRYIIY